MIKKEFEKLTNLVLTDEQFVVINEMYMQHCEEGLEEFCKNYMAMSCDEVLNEFYKILIIYKDWVKVLDRECNETREFAQNMIRELKRVKTLCENMMDAWNNLEFKLRNRSTEG